MYPKSKLAEGTTLNPSLNLIDFDTLFDKIFVSNVNIILKPLKWEIYNVEEDLMSDLWFS